VFEERPSPHCLADALATAPDVIEVPNRDEERFAVILRDSTSENGRRIAQVWGSPPDSRHAITVYFFWDGPRSRAPLPEERTATTLGRRLLARLRTACMLNAAEPVTCAYNTDRRVESCDAVHLTPS